MHFERQALKGAKPPPSLNEPQNTIVPSRHFYWRVGNKNDKPLRWFGITKWAIQLLTVQPYHYVKSQLLLLTTSDEEHISPFASSSSVLPYVLVVHYRILSHPQVTVAFEPARQGRSLWMVLSIDRGKKKLLPPYSLKPLAMHVSATAPKLPACHFILFLFLETLLVVLTSRDCALFSFSSSSSRCSC